MLGTGAFNGIMFELEHLKAPHSELENLKTPCSELEHLKAPHSELEHLKAQTFPKQVLPNRKKRSK